MIWNQPTIYLPSQAIWTALNVYGKNVCKIVPIDSPAFGRVMVCVGAMMVGSIYTTVKEGEHVKHSREFGYFGFGIYSQIENLISSANTLCSGGSTITYFSRRESLRGTKTSRSMVIPC